jgi:hypothetical protein
LETEIDKDFMSFKRLQEVNFILQLWFQIFRKLPMNEATFLVGERQ